MGSFTIGITCDLRQDYLALGYSEEQVAEFDTEATVAAIEDTIRSLGYATDRIGNAWALCQRLVKGDRWNLVFNIAEGLYGRSREAQVPALLELYEVGYTFSDPLTCAVTLDKGAAKRLVLSYGLPTPAFKVIETLAQCADVQLHYPLFAKPLAEGTGKGVTAHSKIDNPAALAKVCQELLVKYSQPVLVEEFLPGREFTVGVLGTGQEAWAIGTMEITVKDPRQAGIYSYDNKENCEQLIEYSRLSPGPLRDAIQDLAVKTYQALECRDAGRVDIRLNAAGQPGFLEVNPLAGLHPHHSDLPMIATQEGMSYQDLLQNIIASARKRLGLCNC